MESGEVVAPDEIVAPLQEIFLRSRDQYHLFTPSKKQK